MTTKTDFVLPSGTKVKGSFDFSQAEMVQGLMMTEGSRGLLGEFRASYVPSLGLTFFTILTDG